MTDDSGTFDNGTVVNKAFVDAILDEVDDQAHSTTNPTIKPKAITDEVVNARGSKASLTARLDVALNADGTPKAVAGQATETQLAATAGNINLCRNSDLEDWAAGASSAPDHHTLSGTGAAIARAGAGESDTTDLGTGTYAAKITSGGAAAAKLTQAIITTAEFSAKYRSIAGRSVGFAIRAKVANSNVLRLVIDDGVTTTASSYATGSADEQDLSVVHELSDSATKLDVYAEVALGTNVAYVGGFTAVFGLVAPSAWNPGFERFRQEILDEATPSQAEVGGVPTTVNLGGLVNSQVNDAASSGTGETDAHSYTVPGGMLTRNGDKLIVRAHGTATSQANAKTIKVKFGSATLTLINALASDIGSYRLEVHITRLSATTQRIDGFLIAGTNVSGANISVSTTGSETLSGSVALKTTLQNATAGTITEHVFAVEYQGAPS